MAAKKYIVDLDATERARLSALISKGKGGGANDPQGAHSAEGGSGRGQPGLIGC